MTGPTVADIADTVASHVRVGTFCSCGAGPWSSDTRGFSSHQVDVIGPVVEAARVEAAIDTVARRVIADLVGARIGDAHELYPDLDVNDWNDVVELAEHLVAAQEPTTARYDTAYTLLTARAGGS